MDHYFLDIQYNCIYPPSYITANLFSSVSIYHANSLPLGHSLASVTGPTTLLTSNSAWVKCNQRHGLRLRHRLIVFWIFKLSHKTILQEKKSFAI